MHNVIVYSALGDKRLKLATEQLLVPFTMKVNQGKKLWGCGCFPLLMLTEHIMVVVFTHTQFFLFLYILILVLLIGRFMPDK